MRIKNIPFGYVREVRKPKVEEDARFQKKKALLPRVDQYVQEWTRGPVL